MQSVEDKIERTIKSKPRGFLLFPDDFRHIGTAESIRKALQSLKEKGIITPVAHGIYVRPEIDPVIGEVTPGIDEIAKAIAKRDKARIVPAGVYALNRLGLSTQVPLNVVYLTDGTARKIKIGLRLKKQHQKIWQPLAK